MPTSESLADCSARLQPFLDDELWPAMHQAAARADGERAEAAALAERLAAHHAAHNGAKSAQHGATSASPLSLMSEDDVEAAEARLAELRRRASVVDNDEEGRGVPTFVVTSSENLIRALVANLEGVSEVIANDCR